MDVICPNCGEVNPAGAQFCSNCKDFLAWEGTGLIGKAPEGKVPDGRVPAQPAPLGPPTAVPNPPPVAPPRQPPGTAPAGAAGTSGPGQRQPPAGTPRQPPPPPGPRPGGLRQEPTVVQPAVGPTGARPSAAQGAVVATAVHAGVDPTTKACPTCGQINARRLRFCTRCGYCFVRLKVPQGHRQTPAELAAADRVARRTYRRSLPPFYRWRRVGIAVLAVLAVVLATVVTRGDPGRFVKDGWYWLNKEYVAVSPTSVEVDPAFVVPGSAKEFLIDGNAKEFTMTWVPGSVSPCGPPPGTTWITLNIEPTRIRRIVITPGLDAGNPERTKQPLPKTLGVRFGDGPCQPLGLKAAAEPLRLNIDSGREVSQVHLAIAEAFSGATTPAISITEVVLKKYPD